MATVEGKNQGILQSLLGPRKLTLPHALCNKRCTNDGLPHQGLCNKSACHLSCRYRILNAFDHITTTMV